MHLVIPFAAALSETATRAAGALQLPRLERLLAQFSPLPAGAPIAPGTAPLPESDEYSLSAPHEQVVAALRGWPLRDGCLPFAAALAAVDGLAPESAAPGRGWGLLTPSHWHVGTEQVSLVDPAALDLAEPESRALHDALRPLFEEVGWGWHWGTPQRWYVTHESLADTPTASLDRVSGRNVDLWLNGSPALSAVRRLQAEVQMLLYTHPVNDARAARGLQPVNSFWLSGTGPAAVALRPLPAEVAVDDRLRAPALAEDWAGWAEAWAALDAGPLAALLAATDDAPPRLTLCGERRSRTWTRAPRGFAARLLGARQRAALPVLESL